MQRVSDADNPDGASPVGFGISVCVPTYQGALHIGECLKSVATQKGVHVEIIVRDDRSSDGTIDIVRAVAHSFPKVEWVIRENPERLGMVENWNACVALAQYPLIKMMGQDDLLFPDCLAVQAGILAAYPSVALTSSRRTIINATGRGILRAPAPFVGGIISGKEAAVRCLLSATNTIGDPVAVLARTELVRKSGGFECSFRYCTDVAMLMRLLSLGDFFFDPTPRVGYRVHTGAVGNTSQQIVVSEFSRCVRLAEEVFKMHFTPETRRLIAFKSHALSLVRQRLYGLLNSWPFVSGPR